MEKEVVLTNAPEEWVWDHFEKGCAQNILEPAVFQDTRKRPYYLDAIVWVHKKWFHKKDSFIGTVEGITSRQFIKKFPCTLKTFYIDVRRVRYRKSLKDSRVVARSDGDFVYFIKDKSQLNKVWEFYNKYQDK